MVAVALGESGGNTRAHNTNSATGDNSYGLWQINMIGNLGPSRRQQFGISSNDQLFDPATNARAMVKILRSEGARAWSVFRHGTYLRHLSTALRAVENPSGDTLPPAELPGEDGGLLSGIGDIAGAIGGFADFVTDTKNWIRVGQFIGGGILIVVAVAMFAGKNVADVVPVGKALKAARGLTSK